MTERVLAEWVEEVLQHLARWNILFVHLGDAYPAARESLLPRMDSVVEIERYIQEKNLDGTIRLVSDVEKLLELGSPTLGQLRERVIADRDNGVRVVLLSRRPRIAYPTPPGSEILRDAKLVTPPVYLSPLDAPRFGEEATREGTPLEITVAQTMRELGEAACAELDALVFEDGREDQELTSLEEPLREALISSGMVTSIDGHLRWAIEDARVVVRGALGDVIAGMGMPQPDFGRVSGQCWAVERRIKQALRARARVLWGETWAAELLDAGLGMEALARACRGTYSTAETLEDLRDPLEWLSLAETLDLRADSGVGSLGVPESMWQKLRSELLPVKDRIERSQLIRRSDADIAHRWADLLRTKLSTSGSRSVEESLGVATVSQRELLTEMRRALSDNPSFRGDVEKDFMSLVLSTVRFLAHTLDARPEYTAHFAEGEDAPLERALQDAFKAFLDSSDLAGRSVVEVSSLGGGRADVVLFFDDGTRYVTEVKRDFARSTREALEAAYLPQAVAYQSANVPLGQLLVLDLTRDRDVNVERLDQSIWVAHGKDATDTVVSSTVVAVVRGNRTPPSRRRI